MRRRNFSLLFVSILVTLLIPALAMAKSNTATEQKNTTSDTSTENDIILVKEVLDLQYDDTVNTNLDLLKENIVEKAFDFTSITKLLKTRKDCTIVGTYSKAYKNSAYNYDQLLDKLTDSVYSNCCTSLSSYKKDTLKIALQEAFNQEMMPGDKCVKTMLFVAQNKKTGLFIAFTPVTIEITAKKDTTTGKTKDIITYAAEVKALNYLILARR